MGKMNELSFLVSEAGLQPANYETVGKLKVAVAKLLLTSVFGQHDAKLYPLVQALNMSEMTPKDLAVECCLTYEEAVSLKHGDILHHYHDRNADGTPLRVRVSGRCQTWKTRPDDFRLPVTHGLRGYGEITHHNAHEWYKP